MSERDGRNHDLQTFMHCSGESTGTSDSATALGSDSNAECLSVIRRSFLCSEDSVSCGIQTIFCFFILNWCFTQVISASDLNDRGSASMWTFNWCSHSVISASALVSEVLLLGGLSTGVHTV